MIETVALTKTYTDHCAVTDFSVQIPGPGLVSIIGANGCGKSTLLSLIARLIPADAGRALLDGDDIASTPSRALATRLSMLSQDTGVTSRLRVRELIAFGRFPHSRGRLTAQCNEVVHRVIEQLDLAAIADCFVDEISGGQRQRAYIGMVLAQDTPCILLDEPLNNLDMKHATQVMTMLANYARDEARTIVVVIHDINVAAAFSDHLIAMKDGGLHTIGTPEQVMTPDVLSDVFGFDIEVERLRGKLTAIYY